MKFLGHFHQLSAINLNVSHDWIEWTKTKYVQSVYTQEDKEMDVKWKILSNWSHASSEKHRNATPLNFLWRSILFSWFRISRNIVFWSRRCFKVGYLGTMNLVFWRRKKVLSAPIAWMIFLVVHASPSSCCSCIRQPSFWINYVAIIPYTPWRALSPEWDRWSLQCHLSESLLAFPLLFSGLFYHLSCFLLTNITVFCLGFIFFFSKIHGWSYI